MIKQKGGGEKMQHIVKITKYKHRCSINIPVELVRKRSLNKFTHVIMETARNGHIKLKGYRHGQKTK